MEQPISSNNYKKMFVIYIQLFNKKIKYILLLKNVLFFNKNDKDKVDKLISKLYFNH